MKHRHIAFVYAQWQEDTQGQPVWCKHAQAAGVSEKRGIGGAALEVAFLMAPVLTPVASQEKIAVGRLIQVLDKPWPARFAYYAVTQPGATDRNEVRVFLDWIREEAAR